MIDNNNTLPDVSSNHSYTTRDLEVVFGSIRNPINHRYRPVLTNVNSKFIPTLDELFSSFTDDFIDITSTEVVYTSRTILNYGTTLMFTINLQGRGMDNNFIRELIEDINDFPYQGRVCLIFDTSINRFIISHLNDFDFKCGLPSDTLLSVRANMTPYFNRRRYLVVCITLLDTYKFVNPGYIDLSRDDLQDFKFVFPGVNTLLCNTRYNIYDPTFANPFEGLQLPNNGVEWNINDNGNDSDAEEIYREENSIDTIDRLLLTVNTEAQGDISNIEKDIEITFDEQCDLIDLLLDNFPTTAHAGLFSMFNVETESDISKLIEGISKTLPVVHDTGAQVQKTLLDIQEKLNGLDPNSNKETKALLEKLGKEIGITGAVDKLSKGLSLFFLVAACIYFNERRDDISKLVFVGAIVVNVFVNRDTIGAILKSMSNLFHTAPQSGESVVSSLVLCLYSLSFRNMKFEQLPSGVLSMLSGFERAQKSLGSILDLVVNMFKELATYVVDDVHLPDGLKYFKINQEHVKEYVLRVDKIIDAVRTQQFDYTESNHQHLICAIQAGQKLMLELPNSESSCKSIMLTQLHALDKIRTEFARVFSGSGGIRVEPVSAIFSGGPGTFKTVSIDHTINAVAPSILSDKELRLMKEDRAAIVYTREIATKYYDGYNNSVKIMVIDDFLQQKEFPSEHTEVSDFMSAMSNWNKNLHMAGLDKKGNTFMNAKLVIGTCNLLDIKSEMIISQEALKRRFNKHYVVSPKEEFCSDKTVGLDLMCRRFDVSKLPKGPLGIPSVVPDNSWFHEYNTVENCFTGRVLNWEEMCDDVISAIKLKERQYEQMKLELASTFDKACLYTTPQGGFQLDVVVKPKSKLITESTKCPNLPLDEVTRAMCILDEYCGEEAKIGNVKPSQQLYHLLDIFGNRSIANNDFMHRSVKIYTLINTYGNEICVDIAEGDITKYIKSVERITMEFGPKVNLLQDTTVGDMKAFLSDKYEVAKTYFEGPMLGHIRSGLAAIQPYLPFISMITLVTGGAIGLRSLVGWIHQDREIIPYDYYVDDPDEKVAIQEVIRKRKESKFWQVIDPLINNPTMSKEDFDLKYPKEPTEAQSQSAKMQVKQPVRTLKQARMEFHAQMGYGSDKSGVEKVDKFIQKNVYNVFIKSKKMDGKEYKLGYITFVKGTVALAPLHFANLIVARLDNGVMDDGDLVVFVNNLGKSERRFSVTAREFVKGTIQTTDFDALDLMLVSLPYQRINEHTSIVELFPYKKQLNDIDKFEARIIFPHQKGIQYYFGVAKAINNHPIVDKGVEQYTIKRAYAYMANTEIGDCGGLLTELNASNQGAKIFGMHVGGNATCSLGIATCIYREDIEKGLENIVFVEDELLDKDFEAQGSFLFMDRFDQFEDLEKPVHAVAKTNIIKSDLYECFGPATKAPAKLKTFTKEGNIIDPYRNALSKYNVGTAFVYPEVLDALVFSEFDFLMKISKTEVSNRLLTIDEAIKGIENEPDFKGIALGTSPGYPYIHMKQTHQSGKHFWFGYDGYNVDTKEARQFYTECSELIDKYKNNIRPAIFFTNNLKDETRPIEKVEQGKTRLFNGCSMLCLTTVRMYFGSFVMFMTKNRIQNGVALGVNPYSDEWDNLRIFLTSEGNVVGAGDFSGFDGSQVPQLLWAVLDIINKWYDDGEENKHIRKMMWFDVVNSTHIKHKEVYRWHGSLPSGHPLTPIINCLYNHLAFRYCWYRINDNSVPSLWDFDSNVHLCVLGDDNVFGVSKSYEEIFNEFTIVPFMAEINLTYTPEHKGCQGTKLRNIGEVEFLKRTFRYEKYVDRYVAPLRLEVILEMVYWTKRKNSRQITLDNVDCALRELSFHGQKVFIEQSEILIRALKNRMDERPYSTSYLYYLDKTLNQVLEY